MTKVELQKQLSTFWEVIMAKLWVPTQSVPVTKEKDFFALVEEARREWHVAVSHFNQVTDHDLVDHAVYAMEAAERKYTYLLKEARKNGYRLPATLDALRERKVSHADN